MPSLARESVRPLDSLSFTSLPFQLIMRAILQGPTTLTGVKDALLGVRKRGLI